MLRILKATILVLLPAALAAIMSAAYSDVPR